MLIMSKIEGLLPSYEEMVKAGMHFGRKKSIFNPKMKPYVYLQRDNVYLIDLIKTRQGIISAVDFLKNSLEENKLILFVGLSKHSADLVQALGESLGMPFVVNRWLGGTLTNFKTIAARVNHLQSLEKDFVSGGLDRYTKKEKLLKEKELVKLKEKFGGLVKLTRVPDVVFVASAKDSAISLREAKIMKVKTVGIINTESDPESLDFPIAANDNARRSLELIISFLKSYLSLPKA